MLKTLRVSYWNVEGTDLFVVRCFDFGQTAVFSHGYLVKTIGMDPRVIVGCQDVPEYAIIELGFVPPKNYIQGGYLSALG